MTLPEWVIRSWLLWQSFPSKPQLSLVPFLFRPPIQKCGFVAGLLAVRQAASLLHSRWCGRPFSFKQSCGGGHLPSFPLPCAACCLASILRWVFLSPAFFFLDIFTLEDLCGFETTGLNYEGWNFNFGNAAVTFDTAHLQSSYFHRPSMYSPKLCRTHSQRWGSCMMPLAAPVLLMVRMERSTAEGLNPPCNCPVR